MCRSKSFNTTGKTGFACMGCWVYSPQLASCMLYLRKILKQLMRVAAIILLAYEETRVEKAGCPSDYYFASCWLTNVGIDRFNLHKLLTTRIESRDYKALYIFYTIFIGRPFSLISFSSLAETAFKRGSITNWACLQDFKDKPPFYACKQVFWRVLWKMTCLLFAPVHEPFTRDYKCAGFQRWV